jgi:hypothetical protein
MSNNNNPIISLQEITTDSFRETLQQLRELYKPSKLHALPPQLDQCLPVPVKMAIGS